MWLSCKEQSEVIVRREGVQFLFQSGQPGCDQMDVLEAQPFTRGGTMTQFVNGNFGLTLPHCNLNISFSNSDHLLV